MKGSDDRPPDARRSGLTRWIGFGIGFVLLAGAIITITRSRADVSSALRGLREAPTWMIASLLLLPLLNFLSTSCVFWVLTRRFGRVGLGEMSMLIGAGWLLNYAPLGSGLIGRVAYHKAYNAIRVRDSGRVVVESIGAGLGAAALMLFAVIAKQHDSLWPQLAIVLVFFIAWAWWVALFRRPASISGALAGAFVLKWLDMTVWVLRYLLIFMLIGRSPTLTQAVAIATVSQIATLVPFVGNGLGIREWLVGLTASSLPAWFVGASGDDGITMQTGLSAEVLNRVCELIAASAAGIPCSVLLARRIAAGESSASHAQTLENPVEH